MGGCNLLRLLFSAKRRHDLTEPVLPSIEPERQERQKARLQLREALDEVRLARVQLGEGGRQ